MTGDTKLNVVEIMSMSNRELEELEQANEKQLESISTELEFRRLLKQIGTIKVLV